MLYDLTMSKVEQQTISCPTCRKKSTLDPKNTYRPFCSERCKLIDLGGWANEDYKIPTNEPAPSMEDSPENEH